MKFLYSRKLSVLLFASTIFFIFSDIYSEIQENTTIFTSEIQLFNNDIHDYDNDYDDYDFDLSDNKIWNINLNNFHAYYIPLTITNYDIQAEKRSKCIVDDSSQIICEHYLYYTVWSRGSYI
jgi:hypothetical protein